MIQYGNTEVKIESVGTVRVSTVHFPSDGRGAGSQYWETAIVWPEEWEGSQYACDDHALDIVGCDRTEEDADDTHAYWCEPTTLARMAAAHMRNRYSQRDWHSTGRRGTWSELLASGGR